MEIESVIRFLENTIKDIESHKKLDPSCELSGILKNAIRTIEICIASLSDKSKTGKEF